MKQTVLDAIRTHRLWEPGQRVAVALSGGRDSLVLAEVLWELRGLHGADLSVIHVDHGLHPASSRWAAHAAAWARSRSLPFVLERVSPTDRSEAAARDARYAVFATLDVDRVALAHHLRDQAETVLLHLLRGTGPRGLGAMAPRRDRYVRPLLGIDPATIARYATRRGLMAVDDPSNHDPRYLRPRIRHRLLPLLETIRPGAVRALARSASLAAEDDRLLTEMAAALPLESAALARAPRPLARRRLRAALPGATVAQIEAVLRAVRRGSGEVQLQGGGRVIVCGGRVRIDHAGLEPPVTPRGPG